MARDLRMNVDADASGARRGLDAAARAVDHLGDETRRLQREFAEASREAAKLDRKLAETSVAAAALGREFAKTQDKSLLAQIQAHNRAAAEIKRVQATIVGDSEGKAKQAANAWKKAFAELTDLGGAGGGFKGLLSGLGDASGVFGLLARNPGLAAAAATIAVPATIGIGATAGGVIGAGVGGGFAGLTVAGAAAQSKAVHRAWSFEIEGIKREFLSATAGAEQPTIAAIQRIGASLRGVHFDAIFGKAAEFIEPLSMGLASGLSAAGRGLERFLARSGPYITALSRGAADIGEGFRIAFEEIGDGSEGGGEALQQFAHAVATTVAVGGRFIGWAEKAWSAYNDLNQKLRDTLPQVDLMANALGQSDEPRSIGWKLDFSKPNLGPILGDMSELKGAAKGVADAMAQITGEFDKMFNQTMDVDQAADRYAQSLIDLKKSIQENGTAIDGNSQKALNNRDAIRDVITTIEAQREAAIRAGGSTQAAYEQANAVYVQQLESLRTTLVQMHLNTAAIDEMIAKYKQVPANIDTNFNIHVRIATSGSTTVNGKKVGIGEGGTVPRVGGFASGTRSAPPGLAWVGEAGRPELVNFRGGERVYNPSESARLMAGLALPDTSALARSGASAGSASRSGPVKLVYNGGTPAGLEAIFLSWLMKKVQNGDLALVTS